MTTMSVVHEPVEDEAVLEAFGRRTVRAGWISTMFMALWVEPADGTLHFINVLPPELEKLGEAIEELLGRDELAPIIDVLRLPELRPEWATEQSDQ
jgi:hypothetical protein